MAVGDVALQFSLKLVRELTLSKRKLNEQLNYISYRRKVQPQIISTKDIQPKIIAWFQKVV